MNGSHEVNQEAVPRHTNRLIHEISLYLFQHAHNPVDWYPWGEEALRRAREENRPILLSIGYSTCHWCHDGPKVWSGRRHFLGCVFCLTYRILDLGFS